ncbi:hypothetical protein [Pseudoduganella lutea]|uniref:DUF2486 family protein n=1 Tax=Pseudoduganella lutea TaxID=321985 RepID=A0A4V0Z3V0_9BURK|nr:hypothetical protein [Pseudoduganella lutea]QBE64713.1 hypothetical protein EWM63_18395 [Pseudoduganella lutea]
MSTSAPFDAGIPVLTEVLQEVALPDAVPAPAPAAASAVMKPAVWRTGTAITAPVPVIETAPAPHIDLVVPAEADEPDEPPITVAPIEHVEPVEPIEPVEQAAPDFTALEHAITERILEQLMPRVDALVTERVEQLLRHLAADLRAGLGDSVTKVVSAAVQDELARRRAPKG